jgi:glycosyltransferase involved in cell wall biosynthesis
MPKITIAIITLGRDSLYKTLSSLFLQKIDKSFEIILILQGDIDEAVINSLNSKSDTSPYPQIWLRSLIWIL